MRVLLASGAFVAPEPLDAWHFAWNGHTYRGTSGATMLPDGRPALINTLPLDAYLYGVLGREIAASWAPAAQQAQAIASRTYALGKLRPGKPYDVVATEGDQRYDGIEAETVEGRAAIDATAARIVTFAGAPAHVAYSSCCGGRTADAGDVWKTPYPYLVSVADPNCLATPDFTWSAQIGRDDLERALGARLAGIGTLRDVCVRTPGPGARPTAVTFAGSAGAFDVSPADRHGGRDDRTRGDRPGTRRRHVPVGGAHDGRARFDGGGDRRVLLSGDGPRTRVAAPRRPVPTFGASTRIGSNSPSPRSPSNPPSRAMRPASSCSRASGPRTSASRRSRVCSGPGTCS